MSAPRQSRRSNRTILAEIGPRAKSVQHDLTAMPTNRDTTVVRGGVARLLARWRPGSDHGRKRRGSMSDSDAYPPPGSPPPPGAPQQQPGQQTWFPPGYPQQQYPQQGQPP